MLDEATVASSSSSSPPAYPNAMSPNGAVFPPANKSSYSTPNPHHPAPTATAYTFAELQLQETMAAAPPRFPTITFPLHPPTYPEASSFKPLGTDAGFDTFKKVQALETTDSQNLLAIAALRHPDIAELLKSMHDDKTARENEEHKKNFAYESRTVKWFGGQILQAEFQLDKKFTCPSCAEQEGDFDPMVLKAQTTDMAFSIQKILKDIVKQVSDYSTFNTKLNALKPFFEIYEMMLDGSATGYEVRLYSGINRGGELEELCLMFDHYDVMKMAVARTPDGKLELEVLADTAAKASSFGVSAFFKIEEALKLLRGDYGVDEEESESEGDVENGEQDGDEKGGE